MDIDDAAVASTRANAQANSVTLNAALPHAAQGTYDLVLANILAKPLTLLAPLLTGHLASGGSLVLAGILTRQVDELREAYAACRGDPAFQAELAYELEHYVGHPSPV